MLFAESGSAHSFTNIVVIIFFIFVAIKGKLVNDRLAVALMIILLSYQATPIERQKNPLISASSAEKCCSDYQLISFQISTSKTGFTATSADSIYA